MNKKCEVCGIEISKNSRYCKPHSEEIRKNKDKNRKRQERLDGNKYLAAKASQEKQRKIKRLWLCEYLMAHPCVNCSEKDILVLEFDHRGDTPKLKDVSKLIASTYSLKFLIDEVAKCDVRCANCHKRKTYERMGETYRTKYLISISPLPPKE